MSARLYRLPVGFRRARISLGAVRSELRHCVRFGTRYCSALPAAFIWSGSYAISRCREGWL